MGIKFRVDIHLLDSHNYIFFLIILMGGNQLGILESSFHWNRNKFSLVIQVKIGVGSPLSF